MVDRGDMEMEIEAKETVSGLFCTADEKTQTQFEFVGEHKGGYECQRQYVYVGDNNGEFQKRNVREWMNWRPRISTVFCLALVVGAIAGLWQSRGFGVFGPACAFEDCMCGFEKWDDAKKISCCQHNGMGCPPDNSVMPFPGVGKLVSPLEGCASSCQFKGVAATCSARIIFASQHRFGMDPNKCVSAHTLGKVSAAFAPRASLKTRAASTSCGKASAVVLFSTQAACAEGAAVADLGSFTDAE
eukprot:CAMPEP_0198535750 /NCGR_PEP_ID=MMETSP1462-20131121/39880_1 /TAXON_ID=1333877 /ORGANISM="Brandtodinium nutriculum, Strain RCC3387" /LENGTH=243 /DNA_ID=CAMNT_0044265693 /DNA_START=65 /DNA_END=794 /DNA_ORIENTATION=+